MKRVHYFWFAVWLMLGGLFMGLDSLDKMDDERSYTGLVLDKMSQESTGKHHHTYLYLVMKYDEFPGETCSTMVSPATYSMAREGERLSIKFRGMDTGCRSARHISGFFLSFPIMMWYMVSGLFLFGAFCCFIYYIIDRINASFAELEKKKS